MKRILFLIPSIIIYVSSLCQDVQQLNPSRTVLYTCGLADEFYCFEYYSNMKVIGNKFACITKNNKTNKLTLILNGEAVITAKDLVVYWIDLLDKNKCIYIYGDTNKENFIVIEGNKYGPYTDIAYWLEACETNWNGTPNLQLLYNKCSFEFERMGKHYRHDNDGSIYEMTGQEENPIYKTKDGTHEARFSNNFRLVTIDGVNYVMPIDVDANNVGLRECFITECGDCIVEFSFYTINWKTLRIYINKDNQTVEVMHDGEFYDPDSRSIKSITPDLIQGGCDQLASMMRWRDGNLINGIDISLYDNTRKHLFTANWDYDYVMIDEKKYGNHTPINAFYDCDNDAFGWVTIEGRQLVLYSYKL